MMISDGAMLPLGGIVNNTGTIALNSTGDETDLELIQHGITLQGGGQLTLSDSSANVIFGTDAERHAHQRGQHHLRRRTAW